MEYGEAARAVSDLQRKITESVETVKILDNLAQIGDPEKHLDTEKSKLKEWGEGWEVNDK